MTTSQQPSADATVPSLALQRLAPLAPHYATLPIDKAFNWPECFAGVTAGQWYLVVFRSVRRATADTATLIAYDDRAHEEARGASGLVQYFKGGLGEHNECLSFCLWRSRAEAQAAARLPLHRAAMRLIDAMYVSYYLERYIVTKHTGSLGLTFQPVAPDDQTQRHAL